MDLFSISCPVCGEEACDFQPENYIGPGPTPHYAHVSDLTPLCLDSRTDLPAEPVEHLVWKDLLTFTLRGGLHHRSRWRAGGPPCGT